MSPKRGDRAAPPAVGEEYELPFLNNESAAGWEHLAKQAPSNLRRAYDVLRSAPRSQANPDRQHRLRQTLGTGTVKGQSLEQWQYEVTAGGRIWYLIDDDRMTLWIAYAGTGHPKLTD